MRIACFCEKQWHFSFSKQAWQSSCYCSTQISWRAILCANRYSSPESNIWFKSLVQNVNIDKLIPEIVKSRFPRKSVIQIVPHTLKFSHLNLPDIIQGSKTNIKFISTFTFKLSSYSSYMLQVQITEMTLTSPWQWLEALKLTEKGERVFVSLLISSSSININWLS